MQLLLASVGQLGYIIRLPSCIIDAMERTQISLTAEQAARLRRIADRRGTSMAALIREAVDRVLPDDDSVDDEERWSRALLAVGAFSGEPGNVSGEHDRYLEEAFVGNGQAR